ncbi:hypothetical protein [Ciceribacter azotifigens]|uniref:hypothetical protein n=1 Tax=Ciceribacter azotifigens TaxID=2069303 RepID=UPI003A8A83A1
MSEFRLSFPACVIAGKNSLTADDLLLLRKYSFPDGIRSPDDVVVMLALDMLCPEKCAEWHDYFVESLADYIVNRCPPAGSLDTMNAVWFEQVFAEDGIVRSRHELDLLLHLIDLAPPAPATLTALALDQLAIARADGRGPMQTGRAAEHAHLSPSDIAYVRRVLKHACDNGRLALEEREREALLRIDGSVKGTRVPAWLDILKEAGIAAKSPSPEEPAAPARWLQVPDSFFLDDQLVA